MVDPMNPGLAPNANFYKGMGPAYGQAGFVAGQPVMPTGFLFEGVRWFESTNLPETSYNLAITDEAATCCRLRRCSVDLLRTSGCRRRYWW